MATKHNCLWAKGSGQGCETCYLRDAGYCDEFLGLLRQKCAFLDRHHYLSDHDREDIIGEFVLRVQTAADRFEGRHGARFGTWADRIFHNTRADFFRKSESHKSLEDFPPVSPGHEPAIEFTNILETLIRMIKEDLTGCCKLFVKYYRWLKQGLKQKEMAARYGIRPNTFTQKLRRCRSVIRTLLEEPR